MSTQHSLRKILLFGATSGMAEACVRQLVDEGTQEFVLVARDATKLSVVRKDLELRGKVKVHEVVADLGDAEATFALSQNLAKLHPDVDAVLLAQGILGDPVAMKTDFAQVRALMEVNLVGAIACLEPIAALFANRRRGVIAAISSVAGDRGRAVNRFYGASKSGLTAYLSGLRQEMHRAGVDVVTIKPGFVDTAMTATLPKGPLFATAEKVARDIIAAMRGGKTVVYTPGFWRWIMCVITHVPETVFRKLKF